MREKRPNYWELRVNIGIDPETGKRRQASRAVPGTRHDAEAALAAFVAEVTAGDAPAVTATVAELTDRWLGHAEASLSPKTVHEYRRLIDARIRLTIGARPLRWVTPIEIDDYYAALLRNGLSPASVRHIHAVLSAAFNQAVKWGLLPASPVARATPPPVSRRDITPPAPDVVARLVAAATDDDPDFGMFVRLATVTGARRGELCALRWPDTDLITATLTVARALIDVGGAVTEKPTKTGTARRIALDRRTVDALAAHRAAKEQRAEAIGTRLDRDGFVCSHAADGSKPLRPDQASSRFRHLTRQLGAPQVRLHDLRYFAAAHLLAAGIPVEAVSGRLGHTNPATTLITYSKFRPGSGASPASPRIH